MTWTPEQRRVALDRYWSGVRTCPIHSLTLEVIGLLYQGRIGYVLTLRCLACGETETFRGDQDHTRPSWRPWTGMELKVLVHAWQLEKEPPCPVCLTPVEAEELGPVGPGQEVHFRCPRCEQMATMEVAAA